MTEQRDLFIDRTLRAFSDDLAGPEPAPGGGAAAAYAGVLGASLPAMVAQIVSRSAGTTPHAGFIAEADALRAEFLRLVDEDATAYLAVAAAMKLPKVTGEEKQARTARLQAALIGAARVPLAMAGACRRLLDICERGLALASPSIISDIGVGALLGEAALRGAALNVMVNLAFIKDADQVKTLSEELDRALEGAEAQRRTITEFVESRIAR